MIVPLAHLRVGTESQVAGAERDLAVWCPQSVGRATRPGVGGRIVHEPCPHRVPIQVAKGRKGVEVIFHEARTVTPLPEVAPASPEPVERLGGLGHEPAEGAAEGVGLRPLEQEVEVI